MAEFEYQQGANEDIQPAGGIARLQVLWLDGRGASEKFYNCRARAPSNRAAELPFIAKARHDMETHVGKVSAAQQYPKACSRLPPTAPSTVQPRPCRPSISADIHQN